MRFTKVFHLVGKENTFRIAQKYEQKYLKLFRDSVFREVVHVSSLGQMLELQAKYGSFLTSLLVFILSFFNDFWQNFLFFFLVNY